MGAALRVLLLGCASLARDDARVDYDMEACFNPSSGAREGGSLAALRVANATLEGAELSFDLVGDEGRASACVAFLRVTANASGDERALVTVTPLRGRYACRVGLRPGTTWQVQALVEWRGFSVRGEWHATRKEGSCVPVEKQVDLLRGAPLVVSVPPAGEVRPLFTPCDERTAAAGVYVGGVEWTPRACALPSLDGGALPPDPGFRWLLAAGDSTMQELAVLLVAALASPDVLACVRRALTQPGGGADWHAVAACPVAGDAFDALLDLNFSNEALRCEANHDHWRDFDARPRPGVRVSFVWAGGAEPCLNAGGASSLASDDRRRKLAKLLESGGGQRPDAVLFNSGLHDGYHHTRAAPRFSRARYAAHLSAAWDVLVAAAAPGARLIWSSTPPTFQHFECEGTYGNPGVKVMNALAAPIARDRGAAILDAHALRYLRPGDGDGHHCRGGPSCAAQLRVLLALLRWKESPAVVVSS